MVRRIADDFDRSSRRAVGFRDFAEVIPRVGIRPRVIPVSVRHPDIPFRSVFRRTRVPVRSGPVPRGGPRGTRPFRNGLPTADRFTGRDFDPDRSAVFAVGPDDPDGNETVRDRDRFRPAPVRPRRRVRRPGMGRVRGPFRDPVRERVPDPDRFRGRRNRRVRISAEDRPEPVGFRPDRNRRFRSRHPEIPFPDRSAVGPPGNSDRGGSAARYRPRYPGLYTRRRIPTGVSIPNRGRANSDPDPGPNSDRTPNEYRPGPRTGAGTGRSARNGYSDPFGGTGPRTGPRTAAVFDRSDVRSLFAVEYR